MVQHSSIMCIMWRHPQIPGISINYRRAIWRITMHQSINTITNPEEIGGDTKRSILTLFNGTYFRNSGHKDRAVNAAAHQQGLYT